MINLIKRKYHLYKASKLRGKPGPVAYTRWIYHLTKAEKL